MRENKGPSDRTEEWTEAAWEVQLGFMAFLRDVGATSQVTARERAAPAASTLNTENIARFPPWRSKFIFLLQLIDFQSDENQLP